MAAIQYPTATTTYRSPSHLAPVRTAGVPANSGLGFAATGGLAVFRVAGAGLLGLADSAVQSLFDRVGEGAPTVAARAAYELGHGMARDFLRAA